MRKHRKLLASSFLNISRSPSAVHLISIFGRNQISQGTLNGCEADFRASQGNLLLGILSRYPIDEGLDTLRLGYLSLTEIIDL